jgi:hypothetical protein
MAASQAVANVRSRERAMLIYSDSVRDNSQPFAAAGGISKEPSLMNGAP